MGKYRKKPVVIEAIRFTYQNRGEVAMFMRDADSWPSRTENGCDVIMIRTLEGVMRADAGDWIIRGVKGEVYPCKPDIFAATYEPVE